jgi:hypothetical protein
MGMQQQQQQPQQVYSTTGSPIVQTVPTSYMQ